MFFEGPGKVNTEATIDLALKTARERGIKDVVVATTGGDTPEFLHDTEGLNIVVVTHVFGQKEPGTNTLTEEKRSAFIAKGYKVCTMTHALSGAERALSSKYTGVYPVEMIAHTLRMFGAGTKVCVEICAMAADAGMIQPATPVIAIGGTGRGADTAIILRAAHTNRILETKIDEIICKPIAK